MVYPPEPPDWLEVGSRLQIPRRICVCCLVIFSDCDDKNPTLDPNIRIQNTNIRFGNMYRNFTSRQSFQMNDKKGSLRTKNTLFLAVLQIPIEIVT